MHSQTIAAIHVAKKQLGFDDDTYRAFLAKATGKTSTAAMTDAERLKVVEAFRKAGFKPASKGVSGPFAKKLQALWIDAWNLGIVRDRGDGAMLAFVKRQTGFETTRFLLDAEDAAKAIDALKAWMTREAGVDWSNGRHIPDWQRKPGAKVALAQWALLAKARQVEASFAAFAAFVQDHAFNPIPQMTDREWAGVSKTLGGRVRKVR